MNALRIYISRPILLLSIFARLASSTFNLNISGPDWDYTAKDLANTTSQACQDAYSADIECDVTLLGLVASMRPGFQPTPSDFDNTCTPGCTASLVSYIQSVQEACTAPGDKAQEDAGGSQMTLNPVEIVGQIFQYTLVRECSKSADGTYCHFQALANAATFPCTDECAISFYQSAHDYPASSEWFNYYWLIPKSSWWEDAFATGWTRLEYCGKAVEKSVSSSSTTTITPTTTGGLTVITSTTTSSSTLSSSTAQAGNGVSSSTTSILTSASQSSSKVSPTSTTSSGTTRKASSLFNIALLCLIYSFISV